MERVNEMKIIEGDTFSSGTALRITDQARDPEAKTTAIPHCVKFIP